MKQIQSGDLVLYDLEPVMVSMRDEVLQGLSRQPKSLPSKLFYDEVGSALFDRICELDEYYPTRTELAITRDHVKEIAAAIGPRCRLVELGSGSSVKIRVLLDNIPDVTAYVPIEISRSHLLATAQELAAEYPGIAIVPICADYTRPIGDLPADDSARTVVYFPGSTIGNFERHDAREFLTRVHDVCGYRGGLLIGVDLVKDREILLRAYNDAEGVTAEFNLNLLVHLNRELEATFDLQRFRHRAVWDADEGRIEMRLISTQAQSVRVAGQRFEFGDGEAITTEYSHKYTQEGFAELAASAGFAVRQVWTDEDRWFSVQYCETID